MYETPTPDELKTFMYQNNLTGVDIAALAGVSPRTARRWVSPTDYKDARPIPWADWILILLLTGKTDIKSVFENINKWKKEKTGRVVSERGIGGRPVEGVGNDDPP
jgi:hypothetical protein